MTSADRIAGVICLAFAAAAAAGAEPAPPADAGQVNVNQWTRISEGAIPLGPMYPDLIGCRLVRFAATGELVVIPQFARGEAGCRVMCLDEPTWQARKGKTPEGLVPDRHCSPRAYCYLPGLKRILVLKGRWSHSKKKVPVGSWLVDPAGGTWEPIAGGLRMTDRSADFELAPGRDGLDAPIWGALCYDAHNRQAVAFGGGGVWGRVGKVESPVGPGDWIYDAKARRCRRLTEADAGRPAQARRWFPAHCGTWVFDERGKSWSPIAQPLHAQPGGRILPGMAYDPGEKKIVLFGGDDLARCLDDTWVYDCATRRWSRLDTPVRPPARAGHAMVYLPEAKAVLLAGGYTGGWKGLADAWVFQAAAGRWRRVGLDLPAPMAYASAVYLPGRRAVALAAYPAPRRNKTLPVYLLRPDLAAVKPAAPVPADPKLAYHCKAKSRPTDLPGEWLTGKGAPERPEDVLARLRALPANTWKSMKPPKPAPERSWGSYIYDPRTHKGFAWGGGHSAYPGAEISTYDLTTNRWRGMAQPTNYNPVWLHGMVGGPPGLSFGGWALLPSHARKSYAVDPRSDTVVTFAGDVFSIEHRSVVLHVGRYPVRFGFSNQMAFCTAPHGLYSFSSTAGRKATGMLYRVNVPAGKWELIDKSGPAGHHENDFLCYDSKRDRLIYLKHKGGKIWSFRFQDKTWAAEQIAGKVPPRLCGDAAYVSDLDAVLCVFALDRKSPEKLWLYKCDERKWYTAPSSGDPFRGRNASGRDWSPHYDSELKLIVRITPAGFAAWTNVHVMRLDPKALKLTPLE